MSFRNACHTDQRRRIRAPRCTSAAKRRRHQRPTAPRSLRQRTRISRRLPLSSTVPRIRRPGDPQDIVHPGTGGCRLSEASPSRHSRASATCRSAWHNAEPNRSSFRRQTATTSRRQPATPRRLQERPILPDMPVIERSDDARQGSAEAAAGDVGAVAPGDSARVGRSVALVRSRSVWRPLGPPRRWIAARQLAAPGSPSHQTAHPAGAFITATPAGQSAAAGRARNRLARQSQDRHAPERPGHHPTGTPPITHVPSPLP
jgi:hypothetical protein